MAKVMLTNDLVKTSVCPKDKTKWDLFDTNCKGLMLEVRQTGGKTFYLKYTDLRGRARQIKLADAADVSLSQARGLAIKARNQIALGNDPSAEKKIAQTVPTFAEFAIEKYLPFVQTYKKSVISDSSYLRNQILPVLGEKFLDEITRENVSNLQRSLMARGYRPGTVNRALILIRYLFNLSIKWGTPGITKNPAKEVPLLPDPDGRRERFLTEVETARLFEAVQKSPNPMLRFIIAALILSGSRKREVLDARWEDFDLARRQWKIPTTKAGRPRYVPISEGFVNLLNSIPRTDSPFAFANPKTKLPFVSIFNSWNTARKQAGLGQVRIHDLRHSFASFLINGGRSIYEVQKILGHSQIRTTTRYAHLSHDTLLDAANIVGDLIAKTPPAQLGYINA